MFLRQKFIEAVKASGMSMNELAWKLGINAATLYRKTNGVSDFSRAEIQNIRAVLGLSMEEADAIFFAAELAETQGQPA